MKDDNDKIPVTAGGEFRIQTEIKRKNALPSGDVI